MLRFASVVSCLIATYLWRVHSWRQQWNFLIPFSSYSWTKVVSLHLALPPLHFLQYVEEFTYPGRTRRLLKQLRFKYLCLVSCLLLCHIKCFLTSLKNSAMQNKMLLSFATLLNLSGLTPVLPYPESWWILNKAAGSLHWGLMSSKSWFQKVE